jgi:hypothetical protein
MTTTAKAQVEALVRHYDRNRGLGNTTALIDGVKSVDAIIIAANEEHARSLRQLLPDRTVLSISNVEKELCGLTKPIVLDNFTVTTILNRLLNEIDLRDDKLDGLKRMLKSISDNI